jgi:hypothetical protein
MISYLLSTGGLIQSKHQHGQLLRRPPPQSHQNLYPCCINPATVPRCPLHNYGRLPRLRRHRAPVFPDRQRGPRQSLEGPHDQPVRKRGRPARHAEEARTAHLHLRSYARRPGECLCAEGESLYWCVDLRHSGQSPPCVLYCLVQLHLTEVIGVPPFQSGRSTYIPCSWLGHSLTVSGHFQHLQRQPAARTYTILSGNIVVFNDFHGLHCLQRQHKETPQNWPQVDIACRTIVPQFHS